MAPVSSELKGKYVLVINAGSSSFKTQILSCDNEKPILAVLAERIGSDNGRIIFKINPDTDKEDKQAFDVVYKTHGDGIRDMMKRIVDMGILPNFDAIVASGHRVLMGGPKYAEVKVDATVKQVIRDYIPLGPLHNPGNLACIEVIEEILPGVPAVAVFDTGFHTTMPNYAYTYAIPQEYSKKYSLRRYGFHGISHKYVSKTAAKFLGKDKFTGICCHLGNGCSITAIKDGKCIDTTMGLTPLEGLLMGTRCGDIDASLPLFLMEQEGISPSDMSDILNKKSGLKALTGSNDMRDVESMCEKGDENAILANNMFNYRVIKYIGAYLAVLGGKIDGILFTGGIGENSPLNRAPICQAFEAFGLELDEEKNKVRSGEPREITKAGSKIKALVVPTNEELEIMQTTLKILGY